MKIYETSHLPGRTIITAEGTEYLWFSGTDYLGMGHSPDYRRFLNQGLDLYGMHYGSSRNSSVRLTIFQETEKTFANFVNSPGAIFTSSGMLAGRLVMQEIENLIRQHKVFTNIKYHYTTNTHPAIRGNDFVPATSNWADSLIEATKQINNSPAGTAHIICTDAIGSPLVKAYDFSLFNKITNAENVYLIIDQSHALGVCGEIRTGVQVPDRFLTQTIFVSSLNKALGIPAGAIWGSRKFMDLLRSSPLYSGASPCAPAFVFAFNELLQGGFYQQALDRLRANIARFSAQLNAKDLFHSVHNYPVFCAADTRLYTHLLASGIMPTHFPYPSPTDQPITRIVITALHQQKDLDLLAEVCNQFKVLD